MSSLDVLAAAQRLQQQDQPYALVTVLRVIAPASARPGDKAIVTADGIQQGWIGGGCAQPAVLRTVRQALADGRARMIRIAPSDIGPKETAHAVPAPRGDEPPWGGPAPAQGGLRELDDVLEFGMACHSGGTLELFIDPMLPRARLTVIGDSPLAVALAGLAPRVGLPVTVLAHAADATRFPDAERVISSDDPAAAAAAVAPGSFVIVATQGRRDLQGLRAALALQARTVFFVASARKAMVLKESLAEAGQDAAAVAAIVAPAGHAIGALTPEEIALSVLAAVVAARRGAGVLPEPAPATAPATAHASGHASAPASAPASAHATAHAPTPVAAPSSVAPERSAVAARKPLPPPDLPAIAGSCCGGAEPASVAEPIATAVAAPKSCCGG